MQSFDCTTRFMRPLRQCRGELMGTSIAASDFLPPGFTPKHEHLQQSVRISARTICDGHSPLRDGGMPNMKR